MENFRSRALSALIFFSEKGGMLEEFFKITPMEEREKGPAKELAIGTLRHSLALKEMACMLNGHRPIKLKGPCLWLLKMALYQYKWMTGLPSYAIVNETVEMAKLYSPHQAKFLNALLRKIDKMPSIEEIKKEAVRYSLPDFVYRKLKQIIPQEKWQEVLEQSIARPKTMLRSKEPLDLEKIAPFKGGDVYLYTEEKGKLSDYLSKKGVYVQNITPIELVHFLYEESFSPKSVIDLCAAPGGKLTLASALFPESDLYGVDIAKERLATLKANLERLSIKATVWQQDSREIPQEKKYDLVILDVPCSNTGVMHKKIEAKYRLSEEELSRLVNLSHELLLAAKELVSQTGEIWFMTCSLLFEENEGILPFAEQMGLKVARGMLTCYPDKAGRDGGFGVAFTRK